MPWIEPKVDWNNSNVPVASDFNRIEGNTKDLKDLNDNKLDNNGDGKEVVVTFAAGTDTEISSGEKLSVMFGKLLTKLRNINTAITNITVADATKMPLTGGTFTGIVTAQSNTSYTVRQIRNIILSTADADENAMQDGDIWIKYA